MEYTALTSPIGAANSPRCGPIEGSNEPFRVAEFESRPHQNVVPTVAEHRAFLLLESDGGAIRQQRDGVLFEGTRRVGDIDIVPAGTRGHCHSQARQKVIMVQLSPELLNRVARSAFDLGQAPEPITRFAVRDETLRNLILLLHAQTQERHDAPTRGGDLMLDSLATAFAVQLLHHHAHARHHLKLREPTCDTCGGLSATAQKQVLQWIEENLAEKLSLDAAANVVGLSRYHFLRAFKTSFGVTPHQYIIEQRVQRAKTLMNQPQLTLREIAGRCGFSDQSHLTRHFRRLTGLTPKTWEDAHRK